MRWQWMAIDAAAVCLFVLVGLYSHGTMDAFGLMRSLPAFLGGWFVVGLLTGLYRAQSPKWAFIATCLLGTTVGIAFRNQLIGRGLLAPIPPAFWIVALTGITLFTGIPRLVAAVRTKRAIHAEK